MLLGCHYKIDYIAINPYREVNNNVYLNIKNTKIWTTLDRFYIHFKFKIENSSNDTIKLNRKNIHININFDTIKYKINAPIHLTDSIIIPGDREKIYMSCVLNDDNIGKKESIDSLTKHIILLNIGYKINDVNMLFDTIRLIPKENYKNNIYYKKHTKQSWNCL